MKKIIVFDLDGVLFDSSKMVNKMLFDLYPTITDEKIQEILRGNFHEELKKFKENNPHKDMTEEEKTKYFDEYTSLKAFVPLYEDMAEVVTRLYQAGHTLVISTSAFEKNTLPMLEKAGIKNYFDYIATAEVSKSKTEKFKIIMKKYSVSEDALIFITDTVGDIREANVLNIPTIAVRWGGQSIFHLKQEKYPNVVKMVNEPKELLKDLLS